MITFVGEVVRRFSCSALFILPTLLAIAQNEDDALRLSTVSPGGTARSIGLANAFGALGADGGSICINPAGLGLYRISEISLTPGFEINNINSGYYGTNASDTRARFFLGNFTLALHSPSPNGSNWRSSTFGMVYDRQATYHWRSQAQADRVGTSILDDFASQAEGTLANDLYNALPFTAGLAYDVYGINPVDPTDSLGTSYVAALPTGAQVGQSHTIDSHGATSNTSFFWSGNYMDRFYLGLSIGIIGHRYNRTTTHSETTLDEAVDLKDMRYQETLSTSGNGIDVKAGFIVRLSKRFRTGLAFHSPMWTQLNDAYTSEVKTNFRSPDSEGRTSYTSSSPDGSFNYRVQSPWRLVASAAYIAGDHGLFSVDYEYADYGNARFRPSNRIENAYDFEAENERIKSSFRGVHTVRAGTEWRSGNWYFRLGWGFVPDAFVKDDGRHGQALRTFAGGIGYRTDHVGVDLGLNYQERTTIYFQYDPSLVAATTEQRTTVRSLVTISLRP